MSGVWCLVSGVWCLVSGVWCLVSGVWCLVSGAWRLASGTDLPQAMAMVAGTSPRPRGPLGMFARPTGEPTKLVSLLYFPTCRQQWGEITCYDSCASCDSMSSCDFSSCYDDEVFTDTLLDKVRQLHML